MLYKFIQVNSRTYTVDLFKCGRTNRAYRMMNNRLDGHEHGSYNFVFLLFSIRKYWNIYCRTKCTLEKFSMFWISISRILRFC